MKNKLIIIALFCIGIMISVSSVVQSVESYWFPKVRMYGTGTYWMDSTNYQTSNKSVYIYDSLKVGKDGYIAGALYLDTNRSSKIFFGGTAGNELTIGNYKSGGIVSIPLLLHVSGTTSYISLPRMTSTQRDDLISSGVIDFGGAVIFNIEDSKAQIWDGSAWNNLH
jgi:hypothetical protein